MIADIPTPALVLDLDRFEANLKTMADACRGMGVSLRPHAKTHKCPEIAKRQLAAGAIGVCCATVGEVEAMAAAGVTGLLLTSPIVEPAKLARVTKLIAGGNKIMLSVGHSLEVERLAEAASAASVEVDVLVDLDVGDRRTGIVCGEPALALAQQIGRESRLHLRGIQAYAGHASHVVGFSDREQTSRAAWGKALETRNVLKKAGFDMAIASGGSTGTYNIDGAIDGITELQCGSYVFMDVDYRRIGGRDGSALYEDFRPSLKILTTVVSASHPDRVSIDAGTKAIDTTTQNTPQVEGMPGLTYARGGDEFGIVTSTGDAKLPKIGERLAFIVPHCDPSVNLYDRLYVVRGDRVEDQWPIAARRG